MGKMDWYQPIRKQNLSHVHNSWDMLYMGGVIQKHLKPVNLGAPKFSLPNKLHLF